MTTGLAYSIDVFSLFGDHVWLSGWVFDSQPIKSLIVQGVGIENGEYHLKSYGNLSSPDVEMVHGPAAAKSRFDESFKILPDRFIVAGCVIAVVYESGESSLIRDLGAPRNQRAAMFE